MSSITQASHPLGRAPTRRERTTNLAFKWLTQLLAWSTGLVAVLLLVLMVKQAMPAIAQRGVDFIVSSQWDAGKGQYGILPEIFGTVVSSTIAVVLASVCGLAVAIFL